MTTPSSNVGVRLKCSNVPRSNTMAFLLSLFGFPFTLVSIVLAMLFPYSIPTPEKGCKP